MASIKTKLRLSTVSAREGTIYYQVIHERKVRQLPTPYRLFPFEWDSRRSVVTTSCMSERNALLLSIRERIRCDIERLTKICRKLETDGYPYAVDDIIDEFNRYSRGYSLFNYMENLIAKLKHNGKVRTAETYKAALNSFKKFRKDEDIMLDCIDSDVMEAYEAWHRQRGIVPNTISFYTRILRAAYNRAVAERAIEDRSPFRYVYTGVDKTVKRALPLAAIKRIKLLDLSFTPAFDYARDMFMLSFYLRGMSFIDMAYLKKSDLRNGYIVYRRSKTRQQLTVEWTGDMQLLLDKYPVNKTDYLLPIIRASGLNERCAYRNVCYNINRSLKQISKMLGLNFPLTMYVARHSWASAAKVKGIPLSVISQGMGHDSESTTRIYLASLDTAVVDRANAVILKSLR